MCQIIALFPISLFGSSLLWLLQSSHTWSHFAGIETRARLKGSRCSVGCTWSWLPAGSAAHAASLAFSVSGLCHHHRAARSGTFQIIFATKHSALFQCKTQTSFPLQQMNVWTDWLLIMLLVSSRSETETVVHPSPRSIHGSLNPQSKNS